MKTIVAKRIDFQTNRKSQETGERIFLFRDEDFYFMYNEDAEIVSNILGINKSTAIDNDFAYTVFHANKLDKYLPAIIRHGHRVAIVDNLF